jgi:hypothetical protein
LRKTDWKAGWSSSSTQEHHDHREAA